MIGICRVLFAVVLFCSFVNGRYFPQLCTKKEVCIEPAKCSVGQTVKQNETILKECGSEKNISFVCCPEGQYKIRISDIRCQTFIKTEKNRETHYVAGGRSVVSHIYRHMVALGYGAQNSTQWHCGGTLISENFVLTAAHCLNSQSLGPVKWARVGDLNIANATDDAHAKSVEVSQAIPHPEYRPWSVYHDIALLELAKKVPFTSGVNAACLDTKGRADFIADATGWGLTSFLGEPSSQLQTVQLESFPVEICNSSYRSLASTRRLKHGIDPETQLCAGSNDSDKDTCQGDSGGPLQILRDDSKLYDIIGVTSFGKACGNRGTPGVYTKVSHYIPWIEKIVWP